MNEALKKEFIPKYLAIGDVKFYKFLLTYAVNKMIALEKGDYKGISPEIELLSYCDQFLVLYRKEGEEVHFNLAKVFRKAGHKIYRILLKKELTVKNDKFLTLIKG
jgi:hypothetical protein